MSQQGTKLRPFKFKRIILTISYRERIKLCQWYHWIPFHSERDFATNGRKFTIINNDAIGAPSLTNVVQKCLIEE